MKFKTKFKDYVPETEFRDVMRWDVERALDIIWARILKRYPKYENQWEKIYSQVRQDFEMNYYVEVNVKIGKLEDLE